MKKTVKKLISVLLVSVMLLTMAPLSGFMGISLPTVDLGKLFTPKASAATTGTCGENLTWTLDNHGNLTISGEGDMYDYADSASTPWYDVRKTIKKLSVASGVTSIGNYAFAECSSLISVSIGNDSLMTDIGICAFDDCTELTSIDFGSNSRLEIIDSSAFDWCTKLTDVVLPETVTSIGGRSFYKTRVKGSITFLNPDCTIFDNDYTIDSNAVVYGYSGSTAEAYAEKYDRVFVPLDASYTPEIVTSGTCGDNVTWALDETGTLTISGTGAMKDYSFSSTAPWKYDYGYMVKDVVIEEGVTSIGTYTFATHDNLMTIKLPSTMTSIGANAFFNSDSLTGIDFTTCAENLSIGKNAFFSCDRIEKLIIPGNVTSISTEAFSYCTALQDILVTSNNEYYMTDDNGVLFDMNTSTLMQYPIGNTRKSYSVPDGIKHIDGSAFYSGIYLENVTLPDSVQSIGSNAFAFCNALTNVTLPAALTEIGSYAFRSCTSFTEIEIPVNVTTIKTYAFAYCTALAGITILNPACEIYDSATAIADCATIYGYADSTAQAYAEKYSRTFVTLDTPVTPEIVASGTCGENLTWTIDDEGTLTISGTGAMTDYLSSYAPWYSIRSSIKKVIIEDGVTSIGRDAFRDCSNMTEVHISSSIQEIGFTAFNECTALDAVYITDLTAWCKINFYYGGAETNPLYYADKFYVNGNLITDLHIPEGITEIKSYSFYGYSALTSVTIPSSVTSIGTHVFGECISLPAVIVDEDNTKFCSVDGVVYSKNKEILYLYPSGKSDEVFVIPENVTEIKSEAFYNTFYLSVIDFTQNTSLGTVEYCAFRNSSSLTSVKIDDLKEWFDITFIDNPLVYAETLYLNNVPVTDLVIPEGITYIGRGAFLGYDALTSATIPDTVKTIKRSAFSGCNNLAKINIPDSVTSIASRAFENCSSLTNIDLPESLVTLEEGAFKSCDNLTEIIIPESVTSIGDFAFSYCENLAGITILNPDCEIYDREYTIYTGTTIYGYAGSTAEAYATKYNRNFVPLEVHTHSYTAKVTLPATCTAAGEITYTCECEDSYTEVIPVDLNNHTGETEVRGFVSFSCLTGGYTGDTYCLACGNMIAAGEATPATGAHTYEYKTMTEIVEIKGNNKIDLVFVVDTTGSMGSYISAMKEGMKSYLSQLEAKNIDYRIAIVDYRDFPSRADTTDYPYKVQLAFTGNEDSVISAINRLVLGDGGDIKETVYSALIDGLNDLTWREDAGKTVILMGDADALNPEPNTGYTLADAVESLQKDYSSPVTLFSICAKGYTISTFSTLATQTGGKCYTSAASLDISEFVSDIIEVIEKTVIIPDSEWVKTKEPTCTEPGIECRTCTVCGDVQTRISPALGHDFVFTTEVDATCTESGYVLYTCERCDLEKRENIAPYGHDFGSDSICDRCGFGAPPEHVHSYTTTIVPPTCTEMGYTEYSCDCGDVYRADYIEQNGHTWNDGAVTKEKTCTENGILTKTCSVCSVTRNYTIPASHEWSETVVKEATCTEDGAKICTCAVCGETKSEVIPAGHTWTVQAVTKEATCTEPGKETRTCTVCGVSQDFDIPVLGHNFVDGVCTRCGIGFIEVITKDYANPEYGMYFAVDDILSDYGPSLVNEYGLMLDYNEGAKFDKVAIYLTQDGTMWRRCIACTGSDITRATYVPYLAYNSEILYSGLNSAEINTFRLSKNASGIWEYSNYATIGVNLEDAYGNLLLSLYDIGQAGAKTRIFDDLDEMKAWLQDNCESHTEEIIPGVEPTCEGVGYTSGIKCSDCGEILAEPEEIPATGHSWDSGKITLEPTCTEIGEKLYTCENNSAHTYSEDVPVGDHKWDEGTVIKNPTCTESGTMLYACVYDNSHTKTEDIEKLSHSETVIKGYAPTCTEEGLSDGVKCSVCGLVITEQEVIPATDHKWDEGTVSANPTCTDFGTMLYVCLNDNSHTKTEDIEKLPHSETVVKGYPATCTEEGLTDGLKCSVCDLVITEQEVIPLADHTKETIKGKPSTCTETGLSDGLKCSVCDKILKAQNVLPLAQHKEQTIKGKAPTCTKEGLTDGIKCSVCGEILVEQEALPLKDHTPVRVNEKAPEVGVPGYTGDLVCSVCGKLLENGEEIEALDPSDVCDHMCHKDGFLGFIWKIVNFFQKLFGISPVCECGAVHY